MQYANSRYICDLENHNDTSINLTPDCATDESMRMLEIEIGFAPAR
jgi:hypothetical protein